jgi:hypothetical protein
MSDIMFRLRPAGCLLFITHLALSHRPLICFERGYNGPRTLLVVQDRLTHMDTLFRSMGSLLASPHRDLGAP